MLEAQNDLLQSLKWKDLAEIEDYIGAPMDEWADLEGKSKLAFVTQYIIAKKKNPELTIEVAQEMSIQELAEVAGIEALLPKDQASQA